MTEIESAVRIPTPPPGSPTPPGSPRPQPSQNGLKRKHPASRSPSPERRKPARRNEEFEDEREQMRARKLAQNKDTKPMTKEERNAQAKKDFLSLRSGGAYIPPARLRAMQASIPQDKKSEDFQRLAHDARKKSINGLVNKLNTGNIKAICQESFNEDLIRARGLLCQSLLKAQAASLSFTPVYAAYVTVINSKLPMIGELLQNRLVNRWAKAFRRNDKAVCVSSTHFLAHLCNQDVVTYIVLANMLQMLLEKPTDDSVEIAVNLMRELGQHLEESNMPIANLLYDRLREILQESDLEKRTLYAIEVLFQVRRDRYTNNPAIPEGLDIVSDEDKVTLDAVQPHQYLKVDPQNTLNIFKYNPDYESNEASWKKMRDEIFGEGSDEEGESGSEEGSESESEDESDEEAKAQDVKDMTADELVQLRRRIYLTITSSSAFEEATHKLMKIQLPAGKEQELPQMLVETCSQRPTYEKFFGLIGQRLCEIRRDMREQFENAFSHYYDSIHRYDTNRLRAIAQFFAHLLGTGAIGWYVFQCVILTEEDTTSSSRIFIKILFEGLVEELGMKKLQAKLKDSSLRSYYAGILPMDSQKNTRFAINYFTSIKMGALTEDMREALANMPKAPAQALPAASGRQSPSPSERSFSSSYYSYSGSSRSRSRSHSDSRSRSRSRSPPRRERGRSRPRGRTRSRSISTSLSRSRSPSYSRSRTPPRRRQRNPSQSRSPPRRGGRRRSISDSRSPSPPRRRRSPGYSRSPPRRRRSPSDSRSPPRRSGRRRSASDSRSPSPPRRPPNHSRSRSPPRRRRSYSRSRSPPRRRR